MARAAAIRIPDSNVKAVQPSMADHPYAKYLNFVHPNTAESVLSDKPMRTPDTDAFARAVKNIGGILAAAKRTGDAGESIIEVIYSGSTPEPHLCADIERACSGSVTVEQMRDDLIWFRDGAGEIIGFAEGLDHSKRELELAIRGTTGPSENKPKRFEGDFGEIPVLGKKVYAINPEIPTKWLLSEASCMADALREVASDGVDTPMSSAAAWLLERNLQCIQALIEASEIRPEVLS